MKSKNKDKWIAAIESEKESLIEKGVWINVLRPMNTKILRSSWKFVIKKDSQGKILKYKARLVADGGLQEEGTDFKSSYSPVVSSTTLKLLLAIAIKRNWYIKQLDVKTAYLNGTLDEDTYMYIPEGFEYEKGKVCKLIKSLYGLRQSGKCWNTEFNNILTNIGCKRGSVDPCIYTFENRNKRTYLIVYVDDVLITGNDEAEVENLRDKIKDKLEITEMDSVNNFLGITINREGSSNGSLDQAHYVKTILERFGMVDSKPHRTPMEERIKFENKNVDKDLEERYRSGIGMINYLATHTRPDIAFATNCLAQYNGCPSQDTWCGVQRIMKYLKCTASMKLNIDGNEENIQAYCDADWSSDIHDRKSYSGYAIFLGSTPIVWKAKKQTCVSTSTQEAEYVSLSECSKDVMALRNLLEDVGLLQVDDPITIFCDNTSAIRLAENAMTTPRSKHIDTRFHYIRQQVQDGKIAVKYVPGEDNVADIFTKPLGRIKVEKFRKMLNIW
jgi:hypothetical protein